jgi:putative FmdB family regulatory protein
MPLLEYRCAACEKKAEFLVLAGDSRLKPVCPSCGSFGMSRLLSTFSAHGSSERGGDMDASCGEGGCAMPGACGPGACGLGEN